MRDRGSIVEELFAAAVCLEPADRRELLDSRCMGDALLRSEVEELLSCDQAVDPGFLDSPIPSPCVSQGANAGDIIAGRYRIIREIGEGGMGVVFLGEQLRPVRRRVAVKLLKAGLDTRQIIRRFEGERQALAMMDHPNIARVLDAGDTDTGRPYFVMDFIDGKSLTEHCDAQELTIRERIGLFVTVCDAVQHAHTKGVIHRDLKPSNIIVSTRDGVATPSVIDFGIAKATEPSHPERTLMTQQGQLVGTLEYMSPEQVSGDPDIDTRTDIYSLGAVLYQVLTGKLPLGDALSRTGGAGEAERVIHDVDPPKPSVRVSRGSASAEPDTPGVEARARARGLTPGSLVKQLKGDLDWIVMRALAKDRTRRYETVAAFAADLRRLLADEPVDAGPPSTVYRVSKFVRRNRSFVVGAALLVGVLIAGAVTSGVFAVRESAASRRASAHASEAIAAGERAESVRAFLENMLRTARSAESRGQSVTVRDLLVATTERLDAGVLAGEPDVEFEVREIIGNTFQEMGWSSLAVSHLKWTYEYLASVRGMRDPDTLHAMRRYGESLKESGDLGGALELLTELHEHALETFGESDPFTWGALDTVANTTMRLGRPLDALPLHEQAYEGLVRVSGPDHVLTTLSLFNTAGTLRVLGRYEEAEPKYLQAIKAFEAHGGIGSIASAVRARSELGRRVYPSLGRDEDGIAMLAAAVELGERKLGPEHGETASARFILANTLWQHGRLDEAQRLANTYDRSIDAVYLPDSWVAIRSQQLLVGLALSRGESEKALADTVELLDVILASEDPVMLTPRRHGVESKRLLIVWARHTITQALLNLGRFPEAEAEALRAIEQTELVTRDWENWSLKDEADRMLCLAIIGRGRASESIANRLREMLDSQESRFGADHILTARTADSLGHCLAQLGDNAGAEPLLLRASKILGDVNARLSWPESPSHLALFRESQRGPD